MATAAVLFDAGPDQYAVAASSVREVLCDVRTFPLPKAPEGLLGAFNLRGEVVPLFDTGIALGIGSLGKPTTVVVVNTTAGPAGLAVSSLPRIVSLNESIMSSELRATRGVFAVDNGIVVLIDVEELFMRCTAPGPQRVLEPVVGQ